MTNGPYTLDAPIAEMSILWLNAGLSCDGETIAMTAATQPSIEDVLSGAIPWLPRVKLYNAFFSFENADAFLEATLSSDTRSVLPMVEALAAAAGPSIRWMRDPTRGGVATTLNELALDCGLAVHLAEAAVRAVPGGEEAVLIGDIQDQPSTAVLVTTLYGGSRIVDMLVGDPLPRIC